MEQLATWASPPKLYSPHHHNRFASNARLPGPNRLNRPMLGFRRHAPPVKANDGGGAGTTAEAVVERSPKLRRFQVSDGRPNPFGATPCDGGVNFAVYAGNAVSATVCLITPADLEQDKVTEQIPLDPLNNKTGDVWHVFLTGDVKDIIYGYKFDGKFSPEEGHYYDPSKIVMDPYAKAVIRRGEFGNLGPNGNCWPQMACTVPSFEDKDISDNTVGHPRFREKQIKYLSPKADSFPSLGWGKHSLI